MRILDDANGLPVAGMLVETSAGALRAYAKSDASGRAVVTGVPAGEVLVSARPDDPRSETGAYAPASAPAPVTVIEGERTDIGDLRLLRGGRIKPLVFAPSGDPWPDVPTVLKSLDGTVRRAVRTDGDGRARFGGLASGAYRLWVDARGTLALSEAWDGGRDTASSAPIMVDPGTVLASIEIHADLGATVTGVVRDRNGNVGIPDAEVRVIEQQEPRTVHVFRTDRLGYYYAAGLPGGVYKVYVPILLRWHPDAVNEAAARSVQVLEGRTAFGIDVTGDRLADCTLSEQQASAINGSIRADFDIMPEATIVVWNDVDTIRTTLTAAGSYTVGCLRPGSYRVRFVPDGAYRTQYHRKTNSLDSALVVTIAAGDTAKAVDFEPQRSVAISGSVVDEGGGQAIPGVRVIGIRSGGGFAESRSSATGEYVLDRLADGSGLPFGEWIVGTDSIAFSEVQPTPVRALGIDVARSGASVQISFLLPEDLDIDGWTLERDCDGGSAVLISSAVTHPDGTHARLVVDPAARGNCLYRLTVDLGGEPAVRLESPWTQATSMSIRAPSPSPWDGRGVLRLPHPVMPGTVCALYSPEGARVLVLRASESEVTLTGNRHLPSGVYFLRWRDRSGVERTSRIVVKR